MIEIKNLSKYYNNGGVTTLGLHNINLSFSTNEIVGIVGESGSGKSTLLNVISGMDSYDDGEIIFNGEETSYFDENDRDEFRKKNVAFINQNYNIIDSYSVLENVTLPLIINGMSEKEAVEKAKALIEKVHLSHRIKSKGSQLSGGEKQRCVIARALAKDTPILACDEPTGNLDSKTGEDIINLLKEVSAGKLVLIVTHNEEQADPILTRKIRIHDGQVAEDIDMDKYSSSIEEDVKSAEIKKNRSLKWSMAWKNFKGTPKKNVFSTIVFTVFSFALMFLYLLASQAATNEAYSDSSHFYNVLHDRMIVYRQDHQALDKSKLSSIKGEKIENAFYEDMPVVMTEKEYSYGTKAVMSTHTPKDLTIIDEESYPDPAKNNVTVVAPDDYYWVGATGEDLVLRREIGSGSYLTIGDIHISRRGVSDQVCTPMVVFEEGTDRKFFDTVFQNYYILTSINQTTGDPFTSDNSTLKITAAGKTDTSAALAKVNTLVYKGSKTVAKPASITGLIGGMYEATFTDFEFKTVSTASDVDTFEFLCADPVMPEKCYELTIYPENMKAAKKAVTAAGYKYIIPSQAISESARLKNVKRIIAIMLYINVSALGFALSFAVYGILKKVYSTKAKDYTIFRSLGVIKSDLKSSLNIEVAAIVLLACLISTSVLVILGFTTTYFGKLLATASPLAFIFFFVFMQLLALMISTRFNSRIYKLSITESLQEERR